MRRGVIGLVGLAMIASAGCAVTLAKRSPWDIQQLAELSDQLEQFKTLAQLKAEEADQLRRAKELLEQRLSSSEASISWMSVMLISRRITSPAQDVIAATALASSGPYSL